MAPYLIIIIKIVARPSLKYLYIDSYYQINYSISEAWD
jgi:hypothetical protein